LSLQNAIIRAKDRYSNGILSGLSLPDADEFDIDIELILTKSQTNQIKNNPHLYKFVPKTSNFDFMDNNNKFYPIKFRILRFKISENSYESIITNLDRSSFSPDQIKHLYQLRWGIETSFRDLKYVIGLSCFHAKKVDSIKQEIFARLILYNFCEIITNNVVITKKHTKHLYQLNYTRAFRIYRHFLRYSQKIDPPNVESLIIKELLPVRPNRHNPRQVKPRRSATFLYRVS